MNKKDQTKLGRKEEWERYERSWGMGLNMTKIHYMKLPTNSKNYKLDIVCKILSILIETLKSLNIYDYVTHASVVIHTYMATFETIKTKNKGHAVLSETPKTHNPLHCPC